MLMDVPSRAFMLAGSLDELKAKGRLVLHGGPLPELDLVLDPRFGGAERVESPAIHLRAGELAPLKLS
jgi:hypothetical protein